MEAMGMDGLRVGEVLDSYCNGYFGSSAYGSKEVVAFGWNWLLVRCSGYESKYLQVAEFDSQKQMMKLVAEWRKDRD